MSTPYARISHTDGGVNVGGLIKNMLDSGFSLQDCVGELIDDSVGAGATKIRVHLNTATREFVISDNGTGMSITALGDSAVFNNRSDKPSNLKRGRFGIGRHTACASLTGTENTTTTLSKFSDHSDAFANVCELSTQWPEIIRTNTHNPAPSFISYPNQARWTSWAIDPKKRGTVTINTCTPAVMAQLKEMIETKDITKALTFHLGRANYEPIEKGLELSIMVDKAVYPVRACNPLPLKRVHSGNQETTALKIYKNAANEYRALFMLKGVETWLEFDAPDKGGKIRNAKQHQEKLGADFKLCGTVTVTTAFAANWDTVDIAAIGSGWTGVGKDAIDSELRGFLNGRFIKRDDKTLAQHVIAPITKGDFNMRRYSANTRQLVQFSAEELDTEFHVEVNKSKIEERLIYERIRRTYEWLHEQFYKKLCRRDNPKDKDDSDGSAPETAAAAVSVATAPSAVAPVTQPKKVVAPLVPSVKPVTQAQEPKKAVAPAPVTPVQTQMPVVGHMRSTSKSKKEILNRIVELADWLISSDIEAVIESASTVAEPGLAAVSKGIDGIYTFLEDSGVAFKD